MLTVKLIGTAATMPLPERALSSAAVCCNGRWLLIDCGEGTQAAARRAHVSLMKVDVIALTHYHGDHIFGLPGLLQTMGSMNRQEPLTILGPEGLEKTMAPILQLAEELPYPVRLMSLPREGVSMHSLHPAWPAEAWLSAFPTVHRIISQGYRLELHRAGKFQAEKARALGVPQTMWKELQQGREILVEGRVIQPQQVLGPARRGVKVVYSGDTMPCDALKEAAAGADLLIHEATYPTSDYMEKAEEYGHSTFVQAGEIAAAAGVRRLWLTHYSAMISDAAEHLPLAQEHFPQAECGVDGMSVQLLFDR